MHATPSQPRPEVQVFFLPDPKLHIKFHLAHKIPPQLCINTGSQKERGFARSYIFFAFGEHPAQLYTADPTALLPAPHTKWLMHLLLRQLPIIYGQL